MNRYTRTLSDGRSLLIREAQPGDAPSLLHHIANVGGESEFLAFGPGEFTPTVEEEEAILASFRDTHNQVYLIGLIDDGIVGHLSFSAGRRPRVRHSGEFSMSVRKTFWGLGIGSHLIDTMIDWAKRNGIVKKINLRVRTDNHRAIALYLHKGFVVEGTITREIFHKGMFRDHYAMGLAIGDWSDTDAPSPSPT